MDEIRTELDPKDRNAVANRAIIFLAIIVLILLFLDIYLFLSRADASLGNFAKTNINFDNNIPTKEQQRQLVKKKCFSDAEWIVGEDEEAKKILFFLKSSVYSVDTALTPLEPKKKVAILPLLEGEEFYYGDFITYIVVENTPVIIIKNYPASKLYGSLAFLFAGRLALNDEENCDEEYILENYLHAFELVFRLLHNKFEREYAEIIEEETAAYEICGEFFPELLSKRLEDIYGKTQWKEEELSQRKLVYLEIFFRIFEKKYPNDSAKMKIHFLRIEE